MRSFNEVTAWVDKDGEVWFQDAPRSAKEITLVLVKKKEFAKNKMFIRNLMTMLNQTRDFFGPCWCKKSIGYVCPQCPLRNEIIRILKKFGPEYGVKP